MELILWSYAAIMLCAVSFTAGHFFGYSARMDDEEREAREL